MRDIQYSIPKDYFDSKMRSDGLEPKISLKHNKSQGTVTINDTYAISFYRSIKISHNELIRIENAIKYIYKLIMPLAMFKSKEIKGVIQYRGYKIHDIELTNSNHLRKFFDVLRQEGALYFYPSKIDDLEEGVIIHGLAYVLHGDDANYYHFCEFKFNFLNDTNPQSIALRITFYPFIKNNDMSPMEN